MITVYHERLRAYLTESLELSQAMSTKILGRFGDYITGEKYQINSLISLFQKIGYSTHLLPGTINRLQKMDVGEVKDGQTVQWKG
jgi:hypothetical protein